MVSRPFSIFSQDYAKSALMCLKFLILTLIWTLLEDTKKIPCSSIVKKMGHQIWWNRCRRKELEISRSKFKKSSIFIQNHRAALVSMAKLEATPTSWLSD